MRLALKAQTQCRTTLEAVVHLRAPKVSKFIAQQNIAHGHQQVNNEKEELENELLEYEDGERLDFGTAQTSGRDDPDLEAVGTFNGAKNPNG